MVTKLSKTDTFQSIANRHTNSVSYYSQTPNECSHHTEADHHSTFFHNDCSNDSIANVTSHNATPNPISTSVPML